MTQIAAGAATTSVDGVPDLNLVFSASNGTIIALVASTAGSALKYAVSTNGGVSWSAPVAFSGAPLATLLQSAQLITDTLYLWFASGTGQPITGMVVPFTIGTNTFGTAVSYTYRPVLTSGTADHFPLLDVVWDGTRFHITAFCVLSNGATTLATFNTTGTGTLGQPTFPNYYSSANLCSLCTRLVSGTLYVTFYDIARGLYFLIQLVPNGTAYQYNSGNWETIYTPPQGTGPLPLQVINDAGFLFFVVSNRTQLLGIKRSGAASYGTPIPLQGVIAPFSPGFAQPQMVRDPATGDLFVVYQGTTLHPSGDLFLIRRAAGTWQTPTVLVGGDGAGYAYPSIGPAIASGSDGLVYTRGGSTAWYGTIAASGAPGAPTPVAPSGTITTLVPTFSWIYANTAANDPQGGYEVLVIRTSDSVVMWDSGATSGSNLSVTYPGSAAAPGSAPSGALAQGGAIDLGSHVWAATFLTAAGETTAGPSSSGVTTLAALGAPGTAPTAAAPSAGGALAQNTTFGYLTTFAGAYGETPAGPASGTQTTTSSNLTIALSAIPTGPAGTTKRNLYRSSNAGAYYLVQTINDNTMTTATDNGWSATLANPPAVDGTAAQKVNLTAIATGPAGTTGRRIYRSKAGTTTPLYLAGTIADNTTTTFADSASDASLGTAAPATNGTGLAFNTQYQWQAKTADSLSAGGAGTYGPYSNPMTFTPVRGQTVTITQITISGTNFASSPTTMGAPNLQATFTVSQADGHTANAYNLLLYDVTGTNLVAQLGSQAISPALTSGGTQVSVLWNIPGLSNTTTYQLVVQTTDTTTGALSVSAQWQLTTSWTPPASVTGLTPTVNNDAGTVTLAWTNPGGTAQTTILWRQYTEGGTPGPWTVIDSGNLWHQYVAFPSALLRYDYQVIAVGATNVQSAPAEVDNVTLGLAFDFASIWINDVANPTTINAALGPADNWDTFLRTLNLQVAEWLPMGSKTAMQIIGLRQDIAYGDGSGSSSGKWFLPQTFTDSLGGIHWGADVRDTLIAMAKSGNPLVYRDRRGPPTYVRLVSWKDQPNEDVHTDAQFGLAQTNYIPPATHPFIGIGS